jgi:lysozyme family protein
MPFNEALKFTLKWEGGYVNHPNDYGGATNYGITQRVYDSWRRSGGGRKYLPVKDITQGEVTNIYYNKYWLPSKAGTMERRLGVVHFDTAVMSGVVGATQFLQEALGLEPDGIWGPATQREFEQCNGVGLAYAYVSYRRYYRHKRVEEDPTQGEFLKGWLNRDNDLEQYIKTLIGPQRK